MMFSSERTKCNGKVRKKYWETEGGGIATRKVKSALIINGHLAREGKCQALTTVGADMLLEKGSRRESKMVTLVGNGGYRKAYNKIVRGSD